MMTRTFSCAIDRTPVVDGVPGRDVVVQFVVLLVLMVPLLLFPLLVPYTEPFPFVLQLVEDVPEVPGTV
jgi:hypothetical protein